MPAPINPKTSVPGSGALGGDGGGGGGGGGGSGTTTGGSGEMPAGRGGTNGKPARVTEAIAPQANTAATASVSHRRGDGRFIAISTPCQARTEGRGDTPLHRTAPPRGRGKKREPGNLQATW